LIVAFDASILIYVIDEQAKRRRILRPAIRSTAAVSV
jgi:hypothetical protein